MLKFDGWGRILFCLLDSKANRGLSFARAKRRKVAKLTMNVSPDMVGYCASHAKLY
jgi:hypothetical protein